MQTVMDYIAELRVPAWLERLKQADGEASVHHYDAIWAKHLQRIAKTVEGGERSLSRVLELAIVERHRQDFYAPRTRFLMGKPKKVASGLIYDERRAVRNGLLHRACTRETDTIIELGAGPGFHLFWFWLSGGPRQAKYMSFEISQSARLCTDLMSKVQPDMDVSAHHYDLHAPDYSAIEGRRKHMVVFSSNAIKEARLMRPEVITGLLDKAEHVTGLHWEPVGFQIDPNDELEIRQKRRNLLGGFNENLLPVLKDLERQGRLRIESTKLRMLGFPEHLVAFVQWRKT